MCLWDFICGLFIWIPSSSHHLCSQFAGNSAWFTRISVQGQLLSLLPSWAAQPGDHGRLFGLALCPEAVQLGDSLSSSCHCPASNGQLLFKLISHLGSLCQHSHYDMNSVYGTAQLKLRRDLYFTPLQEKVSSKSPTSAELCQSCSFTCRSSSPNQLPSSLALSRNVATLPKFPFFHKWGYCPLTEQLKQFQPRSAKSLDEHQDLCSMFVVPSSALGLSALTSCHLCRSCLLPCPQHLLLFVAILLFLFHRGTDSAVQFPSPFSAPSIACPLSISAAHKPCVPSPFLCQWLNSCISLGHFSHILPTPGLSVWTSSLLNEDGKVKLNFFAQWMFFTDDTTNHLSINLACKEIEKENNYVFNYSLSFPRALRLLQLLFLFPLSYKIKYFSFLIFTYSPARVPFHIHHQMLYHLRLCSQSWWESVAVFIYRRLATQMPCLELGICSRWCETQGNLL